MTKRVLIMMLAVLLTVSAFAEKKAYSGTNGNGLSASSGLNGNGQKDKDKDDEGELNPGDDGNPHHAAAPGGSGQLRDHGGPVMTNAKVVFIFWGWASNTSDPYVSEIRAFRSDANGMIKHISMLAQYRSTGSTGFVGTQPDVFDAVPPPQLKVTDTMVMQKVKAACTPLSGGCRTDTIYEVVIPSGFYSDDGTGAQSCGGANLQYCAYHSYGDGVNLGSTIKYSIQPYPSCSGCHGLAGWTAANDEQHFIVHETREAMSDPQLNAWYDRAGWEADDKCAWGTNLAFLFSESASGHTFAYQQEYSNSAKNCVK
jgi:hypothetical protein